MSAGEIEESLSVLDASQEATRAAALFIHASVSGVADSVQDLGGIESCPRLNFSENESLVGGLHTVQIEFEFIATPTTSTSATLADVARFIARFADNWTISPVTFNDGNFVWKLSCSYNKEDIEKHRKQPVKKPPTTRRLDASRRALLEKSVADSDALHKERMSSLRPAGKVKGKTVQASVPTIEVRCERERAEKTRRRQQEQTPGFIQRALTAAFETILGVRHKEQIPKGERYAAEYGDSNIFLVDE